MIVQLANVLRDKIVAKNYPFADLVTGLAMTVTTRDNVNPDLNTIVTKKFPVAISIAYDERQCLGPEALLIPDSKRKSIIYFEDFGTSVLGRIHGQTSYSSNLRLVCWMNTAKMAPDHYTEMTARIMAMLIDNLVGKNPENTHIFTRLTIKTNKLPPMDAGIFGRYTYDETIRQYLRPPFQFFAIDLVCNYQVPAKCMADYDWFRQVCL